MPTTTNYGWTTPADTDLVKDGASAIRTLGSAADTTVKNLNPETTLGDISYRSSTSNVNTRLAIGTTGQVLTVSGGVPAWSSATGGMTLIAEQVASSSSAIDFSSITGTYKQFVLMWSGIKHSTSGSYFFIRFNSDSNALYNHQLMYSIGSSSGADLQAATGIIGSTTTDYSPFGQSVTSSNAYAHATGILIIDNPSSTTKTKAYTGQWASYDGNQRLVPVISGFYNSTSAITSVNVVRGSGSATISNENNTTIRLYGLS